MRYISDPTTKTTTPIDSLLPLADKVTELTGFKGDVIWRSMPRRPLDIMHLVGSNEKIRRVLDVPEPVSLDEGLTKTIEQWRNVEV